MSCQRIDFVETDYRMGNGLVAELSGESTLGGSCLR